MIRGGEKRREGFFVFKTCLTADSRKLTKGGFIMALDYRVIEIFTSEDAKYKGHSFSSALVRCVHDLKIAARCIVLRGVEGCYENGEMATQGIEVLSFNMPLKIEIVFPASELDLVLPVVEEMVEDGIVLVKSAETRIHNLKARLLPGNLRVADIMTGDPKAVRPRTPVSDIVRLLLDSPFNSVPVVDEQNHPVGIITQGDLIKRADMPLRLGLLKAMTQDNLDATLHALSEKRAEDVMTSPAVTANQDEDVQQIIKQMLNKGIKRMPVVDSQKRLTGMLSRFDVFRTVTREVPEWRAIKEQGIDVGNIRYVREILRRDARAVKSGTPLKEVMKIIDENDIQRVMVVDDEGKLIGMVFDRDLLQLFAGHRVGIWDRITSRLTFTAMGQRHKAVVEASGKRTAGDIMKTDLITVKEDTTLDEAIRMMTEHGIKLLPVVEDDGKFIGVVTRNMLLSLPFKG
jgi:CBS domain-containing protein